jgi:hypothetical protein
MMGDVEQPDYKVITSKENIEIRDYAPMILAEVEIFGDRKQAVSAGFKILADYIFGSNTSENQISEKMAMTAPVLQEQHRDKWKIRFVMSRKYSFERLPKPHSKDVILTHFPARRFVVIRFSGVPDDENIELHKEELKSYMKVAELKPVGEIVLAFYNRPSTPPFLRRNEVMIEIK